MVMTYDDLYAAALGLPDEMRLALVENLIPTISPDAALEMEQRVEVDRRFEQIRTGIVQPIAGADVFAEVEESLRARRTAIVA